MPQTEQLSERAIALNLTFSESDLEQGAKFDHLIKLNFGWNSSLSECLSYPEKNLIKLRKKNNHGESFLDVHCWSTFRAFCANPLVSSYPEQMYFQLDV